MFFTSFCDGAAASDTVILRHHFINTHILAVDTYDSAAEAIFLRQCYKQVCKTWNEFQLLPVVSVDLEAEIALE